MWPQLWIYPKPEATSASKYRSSYLRTGLMEVASSVGSPQPEATAASKYQSPYLRTGLMEVASSVGLPQP